MVKLNDITERVDGFFNDSVDYAHSNPKIGLLIVVSLLAFWLLGIILDWKWTYRRPGTWGGNFFLNLFGPAAFRFWLGVIIVIAIAAALLVYFNIE